VIKLERIKWADFSVRFDANDRNTIKELIARYEDNIKMGLKETV
jgi:hypothetical protein